jgi:hypothetical protein
MFDLDAYIERIGLSGRPGIAEVHRAHSTSVAFENPSRPSTGGSARIRARPS